MLLTVSCCIFILSCSIKDRNGGLAFDRITRNINTPLTSESETPACIIRISVDKASDTTRTARLINEKIKEVLFDNDSKPTLDMAIDSFCMKRTELYQKELAGLYEADLRQNIKTNWYDYRYDITGEYEYEADNCLCYKITEIRYEGGKNEAKHIHILNFDTKTGEKIELDKVLLPTYPAVISQLLTKALLETCGCKDVDELHDQGILLLTDIYIPENYMLDKDGITFVYNTDEIAPYETGPITLHIPREELKPIIKKEYKDLWN